MNNEVCKTDDAYVRDRMRWVVVLNNGETVYEDDDRPGLAEPSAWKRLKTYCAETGIHIVEMWLQFRSNRVLIEPRDADGYFLVKRAVGIWGSEETYHSYVVGTLRDGKVHAADWRIPELTLLGHETRDVDFSSPSLILRRELTGLDSEV